MKLSIVTINYNNSEGLNQTIKSVISQTFKDLEYIIIDGGSDERDIQIIREHADRIDYWISEKDKGVYHAMNKGIERAKGEYLLFLNSGDSLVDENTLAHIVPLLHTYQIVYGDLLIDDVPDPYPDVLSFNYFFTHHTLPHQAAFIKRELFDLYGMYNENLKICSDTVFFIKVLCKYNVSYKHIAVPISNINLNGISAQPENWSIIEKEIGNAFSEDFSMFIEDYKKLNALAGSMKRSRLLKILRKVGFLKHIKV